MQQRSEPHDSLDDFPTPPWATRALCEWLDDDRGIELENLTCREPTANRGHMVHALEEYFGKVEASDVHDYGFGYPVADYLFGPEPDVVDATVFNPPFRLAEEFITRARRTSVITAAIVRSAFLEGIGRHDRLFSVDPPSHILQFTERVVMHKGKLSEKGSTATSYCWLVWTSTRTRHASQLQWIAPCRKRLERPEDYEAAA